MMTNGANVYSLTHPPPQKKPNGVTVLSLKGKLKI